MKTRLFIKQIISVIAVFLLMYHFSNAQKWTTYIKEESINAIAESGTTVWVGTNGGLMKIDTTTNKSIFLNRTNSGLPTNNILSLAFDSTGILWIGSDSGLISYDGKKWIKYKIGAIGVKIDKFGNKWVTLSDQIHFYTSPTSYYYIENGIAKLKDNEIDEYFQIDANNGFDIDKNGCLWIATNQGLIYYNGKTQIRYNTINPVIAIAIDKNNLKWIGQQDSLKSFDGANWISYQGSPGFITSITIDSSGNKWIGTSGGLGKFDGKNMTIFNNLNSGLPDNYITLVFSNSERYKWIGTKSGFIKFDGNKWKKFTTANNALPDNTIRSIHIDKNNNKWIWSNGGFTKFDGSNWNTFNKSNSSLPNNITSFTIDMNGNSWFGSDSVEGFFYYKPVEGRLHKFDGESWKTYNSLNSCLSVPKINSFAIDDNNTIWIVSDSSLTKFNGFDCKKYILSNTSLPLLRLTGSIFIDKYKNVWVGAYESCFGDCTSSLFGLVKFDGENWKFFTNENSDIPVAEINVIESDSIGNIWVGTWNGLAEFDGSNWKLYNTSNSTLTTNYISSLATDLNGSLWVGTDLGLFKFEGEHFRNYTITNSSLPNNRINTIAIDKNGDKWIGTDNGIGVFNDSGVPQTPLKLIGNQNLYTVTLSWGKIIDKNFTCYRIYQNKDDKGYFLLDSVCNDYNATIKKIENLDGGSIYTYKVTAVNKNNIESDFSNEVSLIVPYLIKKANFPPKIDGVADIYDPWSAQWIDMNAYVSHNRTSNMSARFQLIYDDKNLYLLCQQKENLSADTSGINIPISYENDCFEVFLSFASNPFLDFHGIYSHRGSHLFRMRRGSLFPDRFDDNNNGLYLKYKDLKIAQTDDGSNFIQEWQIPWNALVDNTLHWDGKIFRFELQASDNTTGNAGGRTEQIFWRNNSDQEWNDTKTLSIIGLEIPLYNSTNIEENLVKRNNPTIFPNPASNILAISGLRNKSTLSIYDLTGKQVFFITSSNQTETIDVSHLQKGIYFLRVSDLKGVQIKKFIKE